MTLSPAMARLYNAKLEAIGDAEEKLTAKDLLEFERSRYFGRLFLQIKFTLQNKGHVNDKTVKKLIYSLDSDKFRKVSQLVYLAKSANSEFRKNPKLLSFWEPHLKKWEADVKVFSDMVFNESLHRLNPKRTKEISLADDLNKKSKWRDLDHIKKLYTMINNESVKSVLSNHNIPEPAKKGAPYYRYLKSSLGNLEKMLRRGEFSDKELDIIKKAMLEQDLAQKLEEELAKDHIDAFNGLIMAVEPPDIPQGYTKKVRTYLNGEGKNVKEDKYQLIIRNLKEGKYSNYQLITIESQIKNAKEIDKAMWEQELVQKLEEELEKEQSQPGCIDIFNGLIMAVEPPPMPQGYAKRVRTYLNGEGKNIKGHQYELIIRNLKEGKYSEDQLITIESQIKNAKEIDKAMWEQELAQKLGEELEKEQSQPGYIDAFNGLIMAVEPPDIPEAHVKNPRAYLNGEGKDVKGHQYKLIIHNLQEGNYSNDKLMRIESEYESKKPSIRRAVKPRCNSQNFREMNIEREEETSEIIQEESVEDLFGKYPFLHDILKKVQNDDRLE